MMRCDEWRSQVIDIMDAFTIPKIGQEKICQKSSLITSRLSDVPQSLVNKKFLPWLLRDNT